MTASLEDIDKASAAVQKTPHRVTLDQLNARVGAEYFFTAAEAIEGSAQVRGAPQPPLVPALRIMTICVIVTTSGFVVVGKSAPADPANFDEAYGRRLAREEAVKQLWPLEGYLLREKLYQEERQGAAS